MAKTRECCSALSLRRTGDDLHVGLHKGFKIRLAGIVPVFIEFTGWRSLETARQLLDLRPRESSYACSPLLSTHFASR